MKLEKVIIAIDFSERSIAAAQWVARSFAPHTELMLVHVIEVPVLPRFLPRHHRRRMDDIEAFRSGARERLRQIRRQMRGRLVLEAIREGRPHEQVLDAASDFAADLIVVGSHRDKPGLWNRFGSTAERILAGARTSVLVVHGEPRSTPRTLLAAVDDSETGIEVLAHAESLVRRLGASGSAVHVLPRQLIHPLMMPGEVALGEEHLIGAQKEDIDETREWLTGRLGVSHALTPTVLVGDVADSILAQSRRTGADLLIMGREGRGRMRRYLLGSVTGTVVRGAICPVLVVPPPGSAESASGREAATVAERIDERAPVGATVLSSVNSR